MSEFSEYSGENLLTVLKTLNVDLLNLHPNVVRAWFDTDCKDMKNFLSWICSSLSKDNYVSPLEFAEFQDIKEPFEGQQYNNEVKKLQYKFPEILDLDSNISEIKLIEQEIQLLAEESVNLDELINTYEVLQNDLVTDLSVITTKEVNTSLKCKKAQGCCVELSEQLDEINEKLFAQITKYSRNLREFEYAEVPAFVNHIDITRSQENLNSIKTIVSPILEDYFSNSTVSKISFGGQSESFLNDINSVRDCIVQSYKDLIFNQIEIETSREELKFFQSNNVDSLMSLKENAYTPPLLQTKELSMLRMKEVLENDLARYADHCLSETRLKHARQELNYCQLRLADISSISDLMAKLLIQYIIINILHTVEQKDMDGLTTFFRKIFHNINGDVQKCLQRTNQMREAILKYENYLLDAGEAEQFKLVQCIFTVLSEKQFTLREAVKVVTDLEHEFSLRKQQCLKGFEELAPLARNAKTSIKNMQSFLRSGPTIRVEIVPLQLKLTLCDVDQLFQKEEVAVRSAVTIYKNKIKSFTKWQRIKRQLWMYFLANPSKMFMVLQQLEDECRLRS